MCKFWISGFGFKILDFGFLGAELGTIFGFYIRYGILCTPAWVGGYIVIIYVYSIVVSSDTVTLTTTRRRPDPRKKVPNRMFMSFPLSLSLSRFLLKYLYIYLQYGK